MTVDLRLPSITARDEAGQLQQLKRYLCQLVEELNWALKTVDTVPAAAGAASSGTAPQAQSPEATFNSIKSLIIKSADVVSAYTDRITRALEGVYVAQSAFGTYQEETSQTLEATAAQVRQVFTNVSRILTQVEGLEDSVVGVRAYLNAGLLYYDSQRVPVYGIEVGQRTEADGVPVFQKYARFTSGALSFYDANDNEVAYISDRKLSIANAQITGTLRQGHLEDTVQADGSLVTKYLA